MQSEKERERKKEQQFWVESHQTTTHAQPRKEDDAEMNQMI
jgi:hypothetical protein